MAGETQPKTMPAKFDSLRIQWLACANAHTDHCTNVETGRLCKLKLECLCNCTGGWLLKQSVWFVCAPAHTNHFCNFKHTHLEGRRTCNLKILTCEIFYIITTKALQMYDNTFGIGCCFFFEPRVQSGPNPVSHSEKKISTWGWGRPVTR